jgi:Fe-S cluster assembly protein SufD
MSALEQARDRFLALAERFAEARGAEAPWLPALRAEARERFREQGLPSTRLEEWRYTNLTGLAKVPFGAAEPAAGSVTRAAIESVAVPVFACSLHVFVDGRYDRKLSALGAGSELHVTSLAEAMRSDPASIQPHLGRLIDTKRHPFAALNTAFLEDGAVLRVPPGAALEEPCHVVFLTSAAREARVHHPRLLVVAEQGSRVRIVQDHVSLGGAQVLTNAVSEIVVGPNAAVDWVCLQREGPQAHHLSNLAVQLERDAHFSSHVLSLTGRLVRNDLSLVLAGEGGDATINGLFVGSGDQLIDNHTVVDHAVPHGTSRQLYKGILGGSSRGVFRGRVIVRPDAQQTDAKQSNPNLLLGDGAEIDTKPQLEIHADDVKCSHGSSIGQLDADALFYLRSRGIAEPWARDLLMRGFAREILELLPAPALAETLDEFLGEQLSAASGRADAR